MEQNKQTRKRKIGRKLFLYFNIFFVLLLLLSYLAPYISPEKSFSLQFLGLAYPVLLIINVVFIIIWAFRKKFQFLLSLIAILIGWNQLGTLYQLNSTYEITPADNLLIKVISYNVRNFDLYNYKDNWELNFDNRNKIFGFVDKENPDIICYQEFVTDSSGKFITLDTLKKIQKANNFHTYYTGTSKNINFFGIATFSAYPIINKSHIKFKNSIHNVCIYTDIKVKEDTIRIYNVHFESIHLSKEDHQFANDLSKIKNIKDNNKLASGSKRILGRLKNAYFKRAEQAELVAEHIQNSPYPVIVCGDFNDTPISYAYHIMTQNLDDAFVQSGKGFGKTYSGIFPSFRIDYMLYSKELDAINFQVIPVDFSDHHPIRCFFRLNK